MNLSPETTDAGPPAAAQLSPEEREAARLAALHRLRLLDTPPHPALDRVTRLAARLLAAPVVLISLVDRDRQWFKSKVGLDVCETPRDISFCTHVVAAQRPLVVNDTLKSERFRDNPLVTGPPQIRAYLGIPLMTHDFQAIGTLCAIDFVPRSFGTDQVRDLTEFAHIVDDILHARELLRYFNAHPRE